jgi:hypothetical protein
MKNKYLTDFGLGFLTGIIFAIIVFMIIAGIYFFNRHDRENIENAKKQIEIENLREDYINRSPDEFLEIPGVRRAVDGAAGEFDRKRDEALRSIQQR